jgi:hypothetical protein
VGNSGIVFAGFDFPIGVPAHYAERAGVSEFREFLPRLGTGIWKDFFSVCDTPEQLSVHRPLYPNQSKKGCLQQHLLDGHQAPDMASLLRRCELGGNGQRKACCLFWTLGAKAVVKAAITGWRDMLVPALQTESVRIWPFDGRLESLFQPRNTVIAETYPAECYRWFPGAPLGSKTDVPSRQQFGKNLLRWAVESSVNLDPSLQSTIDAGFPDGKDDAFDAVVGLFGMLQICLGQRGPGESQDEMIRDIEGWILGRQSQPIEDAPMRYSAATDPELSDWIRWASESGEVPRFDRTVAGAALIADLPHYALLRPVLLKLKRDTHDTRPHRPVSPNTFSPPKTLP